MKQKIKIVLFFFIWILGCTNSNNQKLDKDSHLNFVFDEIRHLKIDSFKNVVVEWRYQQHLLLRYYYPSDSIGVGVPFLLKRANDKVISLKLQNKWIAIDSINYFFPLETKGLSSERIIYCFSIMEDMGISSIINGSNPDVLFVKKDSLMFYYVFDREYLIKYNSDEWLINLDGNWWVEK